MTTNSHQTAEPVSPGRIPGTDTPHRQAKGDKTPQEILARLRPGHADPLRVLQTLIELFNMQHTASKKTVSHKTRQERARFLQRFFRDLKGKAGFHTVPDPRNLGQKHIHAMVQVWQRGRLAPATIQTYLSFLRGLASWLNKPGFIRAPAHYGLSLEEYERHEYAQRDKSWTARDLDVEAILARGMGFWSFAECLGAAGMEKNQLQPACMLQVQAAGRQAAAPAQRGRFALGS